MPFSIDSYLTNFFGKSAKLANNSEAVNKNQNIDEIYVHTITIEKLVILQISLKITDNISERTQLLTNIPVKAPLINDISSNFINNSNFDKKLFLIDNYGPNGGVSLVNVESLTPGSYRGAITMITY